MQTVLECEVEKYEKVWSFSQYRRHSPGELFSDLFGEIVKPERGANVIDLGCGMGRGGKALRKKFSVNVTYCDFVRADGFLTPFIKQCLWHAFPSRVPPFDFGYCCDVMEHIPPLYVSLTLERMRVACTKIFFSISNQADGCGQLVDSPLHMTVMPFSWWLTMLEEIGEVKEARDLMGQSIYFVECYS